MASEIVESANLGIESICPRDEVCENSSALVGYVFMKSQDFLKKFGFLLFKILKMQKARFGEQQVMDFNDFRKLSTVTDGSWKKLKTGLIFQDPPLQADLVSKIVHLIDDLDAFIVDESLCQPTKTASTVDSRFQRKEEVGGPAKGIFSRIDVFQEEFRSLLKMLQEFNTLCLEDEALSSSQL
ncbi:OLC1v1012742C1 [Oldenlandia corymbosa var. corymbosa]|uniref:OLC1v1012742C1 n=1 Tax=Oldenlandia corymbosa var. corymbosa TaxID=529605 RepID=A0AAV1DWN7_OLDCO|nr:OLC1v1012742C1 [Oldenlandia corymbosa var. corymbosa]